MKEGVTANQKVQSRRIISVIENFKTIFGEKIEVQFIKEGVTANQKVQSWRAIRLISSFMAIFGKKRRIMRILETIKQGSAF